MSTAVDAIPATELDRYFHARIAGALITDTVPAYSQNFDLIKPFLSRLGITIPHATTPRTAVLMCLAAHDRANPPAGFNFSRAAAVVYA